VWHTARAGGARAPPYKKPALRSPRRRRCATLLTAKRYARRIAIDHLASKAQMARVLLLVVALVALASVARAEIGCPSNVTAVDLNITNFMGTPLPRQPLPPPCAIEHR